MSSYAIYQPKRKAAEYALYACNFYVGCSNGCEYCYCKKGILAGTMGQDKPQLKKCFRDETHALEVFTKELEQNLLELQEHGLFFSFTTDPMLSETRELTIKAADFATDEGVPVKILTKCADWVNDFINLSGSMEDAETGLQEWKKNWAFGFTLTGHDELEPGASTNAERIEAMKKLHDAGFRTFASIEPIINLHDSFEMICETNGCCDLYKIGLESGKKYNRTELRKFIQGVVYQTQFYEAKVYFKDTLLKQAVYTRSMFTDDWVVDCGYNI